MATTHSHRNVVNLSLSNASRPLVNSKSIASPSPSAVEDIKSTTHEITSLSQLSEIRISINSRLSLMASSRGGTDTYAITPRNSEPGTLPNGLFILHGNGLMEIHTSYDGRIYNVAQSLVKNSPFGKTRDSLLLEDFTFLSGNTLNAKRPSQSEQASQSQSDISEHPCIWCDRHGHNIQNCIRFTEDVKADRLMITNDWRIFGRKSGKEISPLSGIGCGGMRSFL